jgi:hypothetical protein
MIAMSNGQFFDFVRWLYSGIAGNLGDVATRDFWTLRT